MCHQSKVTLRELPCAFSSYFHKVALKDNLIINLITCKFITHNAPLLSSFIITPNYVLLLNLELNLRLLALTASRDIY